jgi:hypothetical protein
MTVSLGDLDAHEQPSEEMRAEWKSFVRMDPKVLLNDPRIDDPRRPISETMFQSAGAIPKDAVAEAFRQLRPNQDLEMPSQDAPIIYHPLLPGELSSIEPHKHVR